MCVCFSILLGSMACVCVCVVGMECVLLNKPCLCQLIALSACWSINNDAFVTADDTNSRLDSPCSLALCVSLAGAADSRRASSANPTVTWTPQTFVTPRGAGVGQLCGDGGVLFVDHYLLVQEEEDQFLLWVFEKITRSQLYKLFGDRSINVFDFTFKRNQIWF